MPLVTGSTYLNLAGVVCCVFLLVSFAVLPVEYTNRHYLSVCLVVAILILQVSWKCKKFPLSRLPHSYLIHADVIRYSYGDRQHTVL